MANILGPNFRMIISGNAFSPHVEDLLLEADVLEYEGKDIVPNDAWMRSVAWSNIPDLSEAEYAKVKQFYGDWPMAFTFYSLARKRAESLQRVALIMSDYCERYFMKTVVDKISSSAHEFFIEVSLLDHLDPALCDYTLKQSGSEGFLRLLEEKGLFLNYNPARDAYDFAPAFQWYLRDILLSLPHSQIARISARASEWFARGGSLCEQAKFLAISCDPRYVEESIRYSVGLTREDETESFSRFLIRQDSELFLTDSYLIWASIWSFISVGLVEEARRILSKACKEAGGVAQDSLAYAEALCVALEGDSVLSLNEIGRVLDREGTSLAKPFQCLLVHMEGENCERLGRLSESRSLYRKALALAERMDCSFYKLFDLYLLARQYLYMGDFDQVVSIVRRARSSWREDSAIFGGFNATLAEIHTERNELAEAEECLQRARKNVSMHNNVDMYIDVQIACAHCERAEGNTVEAFEILSDVLEAVGNRRVPRNINVEAVALYGSLAAELGEMSAMRECDRAVADYCNSPDVLRAIPCILARAKILLSGGDQEGCLAQIETAQKKMATCDSELNIKMTQALVLKSSCFRSMADDVQAMVCLSKAIELSIHGGYRGVFLENAEEIRGLMLELATSRKTSPAIRSFIKDILAFLDESHLSEGCVKKENGEAQGYYALTEREREVLTLLNSGMSRQEIARALNISQNTAKSHIRNIYSKLGIHTRSQAYQIQASSSN